MQQEGFRIENVLKRYRFAAIIYYVRFLLNGAFFYFMYFVSYKKISSSRQINIFFIGFPLLLLAYLINQGGLTKKRQSNGRNFWFVLLPLIFVLILSRQSYG